MTTRLGAVVVVVFLALASIEARAGEPIRIRGGACVVLIDPTDGSLVEARMADQATSLVRGGEHGLWRVEFEDGSSLDAREVSGGGVGRSYEIRHEAGSNRAELDFHSPESRVQILVEGRDQRDPRLAAIVLSRGAPTGERQAKFEPVEGVQTLPGTSEKAHRLE